MSDKTAEAIKKREAKTRKALGIKEPAKTAETKADNKK